jgi:hypothetical protein
MRAVTGLLKALNGVVEHGEQALGSFESIRSSAADVRESQLAAAALQDNLLDDLVALDRALTESSETGSAELSRLRAVPAAVLRWAAVHMHLEPVSTAGDEREMPSAALSKYEWDEGSVPRPGDLVRVRFLTSGWKWRGNVIARPRVTLI